MPQDAVLLMAAIIGLYLYDSVLLLKGDEGILMPLRGGRWTVALGSRSYQLRGQYVFVPNPLLPHRPLYRLSWKFEGESSAARDDWDANRNAVRPVAPLIGIMAVALFVLLPLGFFTRAGDWALLAALVLLYLSAVAALAWAWKRKSRFHLDGKRFAALAFETLVCPPFALNIARRISAHVPVREDLVSAAQRLQGTEEWRGTRARLVARLDEAIELADEGSERMAGLLEHRRRLVEQ